MKKILTVLLLLLSVVNADPFFNLFSQNKFRWRPPYDYPPFDHPSDNRPFHDHSPHNHPPHNFPHDHSPHDHPHDHPPYNYPLPENPQTNYPHTLPDHSSPYYQPTTINPVYYASPTTKSPCTAQNQPESLENVFSITKGKQNAIKSCTVAYICRNTETGEITITEINEEKSKSYCDEILNDNPTNRSCDDKSSNECNVDGAEVNENIGDKIVTESIAIPEPEATPIYGGEGLIDVRFGADDKE